MALPQSKPTDKLSAKQAFALSYPQSLLLRLDATISDCSISQVIRLALDQRFSDLDARLDAVNKIAAEGAATEGAKLMAIIDKQTLLRKHYNGVFSRDGNEAVFDEMQRLFQPFRTTDGEHFDEHFLPRPTPSFMALFTKIKKQIAAKNAEVKNIADVELERKVALRVERALQSEQNRLRKSTLSLLAKELGSDNN